jgi:hypothetical protein
MNFKPKIQKPNQTVHPTPTRVTLRVVASLLGRKRAIGQVPVIADVRKNMGAFSLEI